jgi:hypothetical protein
MATKQEFPLSLVIKAVDKATEPLREVNKRISEATAPVRKLNNAFRAMSAEAGIPRISKAMGGVAHAVVGIGHAAVHVGHRLMELNFAGLLGAGGLYELAKGTMEAATELTEAAKRVGLARSAFSQLRFSASLAKIEQEEFTSAMDRFNRNLGEMKTEGGPLLEFLNKVSPALALQVKHAKGTEEAFALMTKAFERVTDPAKRAAMATAAFGKGNLKFGQWLGRGTEEIDKQRKRYTELAGTVPEIVDRAEEAEIAWKEMTAALSGTRNAIGAELLPAFAELSGVVRDLVVAHRGEIVAWVKDVGKAFRGWVEGGGLQRLGSGLKSIGSSLAWMVENVGGLGNAFKIGGALYIGAPLISATWGLGAALWSLGSAALPMVARGALLAGPALRGVVVAAAGLSGDAFAAAIPGIAGLGAALGSAAIATAPFLAAAAGIAAAGAQIYRHWSQIKELFSDLSKPGGLLGTISEIAKDPLEAINPVAQVRTAWRDVFGAPPSAPRPTIGAGGAITGRAGAAPALARAHVTVDFANAPKGTRVRTDPTSTADVDLSVGHAMATP